MRKIFAAVFCFFALGIQAEYYSQFKQDKWVNEHIFKNKREGVFVDIGANDGVSINNTFFFEKNLDWEGICIEPMPAVFDRLVKNRNCICVQGGIGDREEIKEFLRIYGPMEMLSGFLDKYDARHLKRAKREVASHGGYYEIIPVQTYLLNNLLEHHHLYKIDFLSLDTEGGELDILKSIDFDRFHIQVITVENNYKDEEMQKFLHSKGYKKVATLQCDEVYVLEL